MLREDEAKQWWCTSTFASTCTRSSNCTGGRWSDCTQAVIYSCILIYTQHIEAERGGGVNCCQWGPGHTEQGGGVKEWGGGFQSALKSWFVITFTGTLTPGARRGGGLYRKDCLNTINMVPKDRSIVRLQSRKTSQS